MKNGRIVKIDTGIPVPATGTHRALKYPIRDLEVGQSFAVDVGDETSVRQMAHRIGKESGRRFSVRNYQGAFRCWRVT